MSFCAAPAARRNGWLILVAPILVGIGAQKVVFVFEAPVLTSIGATGTPPRSSRCFGRPLAIPCLSPSCRACARCQVPRGLVSQIDQTRSCLTQGRQSTCFVETTTQSAPQNTCSVAYLLGDAATCGAPLPQVHYTKRPKGVKQSDTRQKREQGQQPAEVAEAGSPPAGGPQAASGGDAAVALVDGDDAAVDDKCARARPAVDRADSLSSRHFEFAVRVLRMIGPGRSASMDIGLSNVGCTCAARTTQKPTG